MNIKKILQDNLPSDFAPQSKAWIYQSSRPISILEGQSMEEIIQPFVENWKSHGADVKAFAKILFGNSLIILSDESQAEVSGCSTDSMVQMVKSLEEKFDVSWFDRSTLLFYAKEKFERLPYGQVKYAIGKGFLNPRDLFLDASLSTYEEVKEKYILPIDHSWLIEKVPTN